MFSMEGITGISTPLGLKLAVLYVFIFLAALYSYTVVHQRRIGWSRVMWAAPVVSGCLLLPLLLDPFSGAEATLITPLGGSFSLAAFKLIAFCFGRGPLMLPHLKPLQFGCLFVVPVIPVTTTASAVRGRTQGAVGLRSSQLTLDYFKQMGGALLVCTILLISPKMHWFPRYWLYTLCSCLFLGAIFDLLAAAAALLLDMPVASTFNRPWLSCSFAEFWASRWNLTTTSIMRAMIYEPIMQGSLVPPEADVGGARVAAPSPSGAVCEGDEAIPAPKAVKQRKSATARTEKGGGMEASDTTAGVVKKKQGKGWLRRFLGLQATFMFSGIWHILVFAYNTRQISYRWALFFILQAPILMCERLIANGWNAANLRPVPRWLRIILTNAALIAMARPLFFGPTDTTGFAQRNFAVAAPVLQKVAEVVGAHGISAAIAHGVAQTSS